MADIEMRNAKRRRNAMWRLAENSTRSGEREVLLEHALQAETAFLMGRRAMAETRDRDATQAFLSCSALYRTARAVVDTGELVLPEPTLTPDSTIAAKIRNRRRKFFEEAEERKHAKMQRKERRRLAIIEGKGATERESALGAARLWANTYAIQRSAEALASFEACAARAKLDDEERREVMRQSWRSVHGKDGP